MYNNYIELTVEGITRGKELRNAFILVLKDKAGKHFLPVLLPHDGFELVSAALNKQDFTCSRLMNKLALRVGMTMLGIRIMHPNNGNTQALIDFELINEVVSIAVPISEAIVAALETKSSIWIDRARYEQLTHLSQDAHNMSLPINAMGSQLLEEALHAAVHEENFELATILRDELKKRSN